MEHTQFFWPLIGGKALLEAGRELVSIDDALARGFDSVSKLELALEREAEVEGRGGVASEAARDGYCIDYEYAGPRRHVRKPKAAKVDKPHSSAPSPSPEQPLSPYAAAILSLDEARVRPSAARTLLRMHQDESTLPLPDAEALLAALPFETREPIEAATMSYSFSHADAATEKVIVRSVEIRALGLSQKGARGDAAAKAESRRLNAALADYRNGTPIGKALHSAGADVAAVSAAAKRALAAA
ncbi:hypothetical protein IYW40_07300 [Methylocystis sp. H4A]|uniref:hypothetical protein n=1 Tax=Methylocystis sp. H4A TaxID=2785788 RepID=UPI0018C2E6B4|nr:hypothetical protein [Methylocystis sp. H4A]MBG0801286.1 hypothetical protein [Methylocystis sp. H4A]